MSSHSSSAISGVSTSSKDNKQNNGVTANLTSTNDSTRTDKRYPEFLWDAPRQLPNETENPVKPIPLTFGNVAPTFDCMNPHLAVLQDEQSSYLSVSKACLFFNQLASYGSSSSIPPSCAVLESNLFHVEDYVNHFVSILRALGAAASHHFDRRCRILALTSLSIVSKAIMGKLVLSPVFSNMRDNAQHNTRLQDEICNDVVMNIISCALEDDDDGVMTVALEALGRLVIDSRNDPFTREVQLITGDASPLTFSSTDDEEWVFCPLQDVDCHAENSKMRKRILSSVVTPKIRYLFTRILLLKSIEYRLRCLPVLNELVTFVYSCNDEGDQEYKLDKKSFASRWYELDTTTLVQEYVDLFLEPLICLKHTSEGLYYGPSIETGIMTATYGLMMVTHARGYEIWIEPLITSAVANLELALDNLQSFESIEIQMELVASVLVALRRLNVERQMDVLPKIIAFLTTLPSTRVVPQILTVGALQHKDGSRRKPARCGYWTEVAVSFLFPERNVDVMLGVEWTPTHFRNSIQYQALLSFLESEIASSILKRAGPGENGRNSVIDLAHELVFVFCSVAHVVGNSIMRSPTTRFGREIWMASSLCLLEFLIPCLGWTCATEESLSFDEGSSTFIFAAQRAYVELLRIVLVHYGKIIPRNSIYYHFIMSVEHSQNEEEEEEMPPWEINDILENHMSLLLDKIIQQIMNRSVTRKIRLSLLCLLTDAWIQNCQSVVDVGDKIRRGNLGPVDIDRDIVNVKERHVRNVLSELGSEIAKLIDGEKKRMNCSHLDSSNLDLGAGEELRSLLTCISCVESVAYAAQLCANHFMSSSGHADVEENSRYLVSISMLVLKGQGKVETEQNSGDHGDESDSSHASSSLSSPPSPRSRARITAFTSECTQAAKRIRNFVGINDDAYNIDGDECFSVDFNCLCPLLKRSNFGVQISLEEENSLGDEKARVQYVNSLWKLVDRWTLIEYDPEGMSSYSKGLDISVLPFLGVGNSPKQNYESRVLFHLFHQQISYLAGYALVSRLLNSQVTVEHRCSNHQSMYQNGDRTGKIQRPKSSNMRPTTSLGSGISHDITGCTDPLYATINCSVRRVIQGLRLEDMKVIVTLAMHNITPVPLEHDIEMSFILAPHHGCPTGQDNEELTPIDVTQTFSPIVVKTKYSNGLKARHHLIWEVNFDLKSIMNRDISASVQLLEMPSPSDKENSNGNTFHVKSNTTLERIVTEKQVLLPDPEVFYFGNQFADEKMFLFLWQSMLHSIPVMYFPDNLSCQSKFSFLTDSSSFEMNFESVKVKAWALALTSGCHHVLAVVIPPSSRMSQSYELYVKSSDESLLKSLLFH